LCIAIETLEVAFFVTGLETLQIQGVEMSKDGSTQSKVRSFEAFQSSKDGTTYYFLLLIFTLNHFCLLFVLFAKFLKCQFF
jgi:hypothetical protein